MTPQTVLYFAQALILFFIILHQINSLNKVNYSKMLFCDANGKISFLLFKQGCTYEKDLLLQIPSVMRVNAKTANS